jgi:hypothetical protein
MKCVSALAAMTVIVLGTPAIALASTVGPGSGSGGPGQVSRQCPDPGLTRQAVRRADARSLAPRRSLSSAGAEGIRPAGPEPGRPERGIEHPLARVDLVAQLQDQ